jgi:formylglycine-generating enzyme required for sulfatase activity
MFDADAKRRTGAKKTISLGDDLPMTLIWCSAGNFERRHITGIEFDFKPEEIGWQKVSLSSGFWIGETVITQKQWLKFMPKERLLENNGPNFPAITLSWTDAKTYCEHLTNFLYKEASLSESQYVSLPTEAQWEYACRATTKTRWYFGDDEAELEKHAWYRKNAQRYVFPVKLKEPNSWNLYDLYGNVREWYLDDYYFYSPDLEVKDPVKFSKNSSFKLTRGGSAETVAQICTSSCRRATAIDNEHESLIGFRVVVIV